MTDATPSPASGSSVRVAKEPLVKAKLWLLGFDAKRLKQAADFIEKAGHLVRHGEPGGDLANQMREFRPDVIVIDMQDQPERGRHAATQLRADRTTRQLPIVCVGVKPEERQKTDKQVTGPTRRYMLPLTAKSVLNALVADL